MSQDDSRVGARAKVPEFSQVVGPGTTPHRQRRNSMPLPSQHGGLVLPMRREYQPPAPHNGQEYWYHVTTPGNFELMRQSGGLMPSQMQPRRGVGLDDSTGRADHRSWHEQMHEAREAVRDAPLQAQFHNLMNPGNRVDPQMLVDQARGAMGQLAREGTNQENLYMSANIGSSLDYLMSQPMIEQGAVMMRVPRSGTGGFRQDTQGKQQDYRALGMRIPSAHIEFAEIAPERVTDFANMEERQAKRSLNWQPMNPKKSQPVPFRWGPGSCAPEERTRHSGPGPGPEGGGFAILA